MSPQYFPFHAIVIFVLVVPLALLAIFLGGLATTAFHIAVALGLAFYLIPDLTRAASWFIPLPDPPEELPDEPDPR